jgi:AraC-like DNA-binding protein
MTYHISSIFSPRCHLLISGILKSFDIGHSVLVSGMVSFTVEMGEEALLSVRVELEKHGFSLIGDVDERFAEAIRSAIDEQIEISSDNSGHQLSVFLSSRFHRSYSYLSRFFKDHYAMGIRNYFMIQRIRRIKVLLEEGELCLSDISIRFNFSSDAHFSNHFKKQTGQSPGSYRAMNSTGPHDIRKSFERAA